MVQNKEIEEKVASTNGEVTKENGEHSKEEKLNGATHESDYEDSDDDDWLDHLLMLPPLDVDMSDRNKNLVSKTLQDFCSAIENRKDILKIKQELKLNFDTTEVKEEETNQPVVVEVELNGKDESRPPSVTIEENEVKPVASIEVPEEEVKIRRQSIRLNKAKFGELKDPDTT